MLTDAYSRTHSYLRISVTDRCNLRCRYCMPATGIRVVNRDEILHPEEIGQIAQLFVDLGVSKIRLTGGEPLVRGGLATILEVLGSIRPRPLLAMTSNGLLLEKWLDRLADAGVQRLNISLDTLRENRFALITGSEGWRNVWDGILAALGHPGIEKVKLNVVVQRGVNDDEIEDFARLTRCYRLDVRFIEMMPVQEVPWRRDELTTGDEIIGKLPGVEPATRPSGRKALTRGIGGPARMYGYPGALGRIGIISSHSCPSCSNCNRLRLTAQGQLLRCLFDSEGLDLRSALRSKRSSEEIKNGIVGFLLGKREIGPMGERDAVAISYSPCLAAVGG